MSNMVDELMGKIIQTARKAVEFDNNKNYGEAIFEYAETFECIYQLLKKIDEQRKRKVLEEKAKKYIRRALELDALHERQAIAPGIQKKKLTHNRIIPRL